MNHKEWTMVESKQNRTGCMLRMSCWTAVLLACNVHAAEPQFKHHYIDPDLSGGSWGRTALVDVDKDGRLDFITGQSRGQIVWYRRGDGCGFRYRRRVVSQHRQAVRGTVRADCV